MHRASVLRPRSSVSITANHVATRAFCHSLYRPRSSCALLINLHNERIASLRQSDGFSSRQFSTSTTSRDRENRTAQQPRAGTGSHNKFNSPGSGSPRGRGPVTSRPPLNSSQRRRSSPIPADNSPENQRIELIKTLNLPTHAEVPNLPKDFLTIPVSALSPVVSALQGFKERCKVVRGGYECKIIVEDENLGDRIEVIGHGTHKAVARSAAYLRFLADIHEKGLAATIIPLSAAAATREKHAMLDVYLFAARYQDVPEISSRQGEKRRHGAFHDIDVNLPLLGIQVTGRGKTQNHAEIAAALNAKHAIEKYVLTSDGTDRKVKDDEVFGLASAAAFWQWFKYQNKGSMVEMSSTSLGRGTSHTAELVIKESAVDEERVFAQTGKGQKKGVEDLTYLVAAVTFARENPDMRSKFFEEYRRNNNQILAPVAPLEFEITRSTVAAMQRAINSSRHATEQLEEEEDNATNHDKIRSTIYQPLLESIYERKCKELKRRKDAYETREDLAALRKTRSDYPMNQYAQQVLDTVKSGVYSIIIGATGSGKTTQVPQILLNDAVEQGKGASCNIICTQPRRIAAKSVSQRVADERAEFLGDCIGYHVKKDSQLPSYGGSVNFCTTGILTTQLQHHADEIMDNASHLIIDEVHERDTIIDFLLTNVKRLVKDRLAAGKKVPHIILMSATIDPEQFSRYLTTETADGKVVDCPNLMVPGRTFPVRELYLEDVIRRIKGSNAQILSDSDTSKFIASEQNFTSSNKNYHDSNVEGSENQSINWEAERRRATAKGRVTVEEQEQGLVPHALTAATIAHIANTTNEGAILTFLPGLEDITKINDNLRMQHHEGIDFNDESKFKIFMLHSSIQAPQKEVFDPVPKGCRKIILATNIAETSITIPDVQHVVDTGKMRELQYDQTRRITKLACVWVSKSNAKQRAGRAGRVQDGNYYALYSKERYNSLRAVGLPELLRSDLQEVCLSIKNQGYNIPIKEFLSEAIEPPSSESVDQAIQNLISLQALNSDESLTALGQLLAQLPVHPSLGKMIVLGIVFRCLDPMLIIGSSFSERNIFVQPLDLKKEAREKKDAFARNTLSDHIGLLAAVKELRMLNEVRGSRAMGDYAMRNFLHMGAFRNILGTAETIEQLLVEHGVVPRTSKLDRAHFQFGDPRLNENSDKVGLIKALILAGFYPNLGVRRGRIIYRTPQEPSALVHPSSINATSLKNFKSKSSGPPPPIDSKTELLTFSEMMRSADGNSMYLKETTPVTPLMSVLFSGKLEPKGRNMVKMDDWLPFYLTESTHVPAILKLHSMLQRVTTAAFKDLAAQRVLTDHEDRNRFADSLVEVLDSDLSFNAARSNRRSLDTRKLDPAGAFAPHRSRHDEDGNVKPFSGRPSGGTRSQDPWKQDLWDKLVASWAEKGKGKTESGEESSPRPSVASLFAEGHADLKSSSSRSTRSRGF